MKHTFKTVLPDERVYETFTLERRSMPGHERDLFKQTTVTNMEQPELAGTWLTCSSLRYYRSLFKVPVKILPLGVA